MSDTSTETTESAEPAAPPAGGISKKVLIWIGVIAVLLWAFAIQTGSTVLMIIVGVLTVIVAGLLLWARRMINKQRGVISLLQGAGASPEARKEALAKLSAGKDASSPTNLFARAQLIAQDDPPGAVKLLDTIELKAYPPAMQDDVSLLKTQVFLNLGRTADARKCADSINLDNPSRAEIRPLAGSLVAEAWARSGKSKEALALLDTIVIKPGAKDGEQLAIQGRIAKVFARFASGQRGLARSELSALADLDVNYLGKFVMPQYRVHPELQKLARRVLEQHPSARRQIRRK